MGQTVLQKIDVQFFARSPCLHAYATLAAAGTANRFTETCESIAERGKMHNWNHDSTLVVRVSRAILQEVEIHFFEVSRCSHA